MLAQSQTQLSLPVCSSPLLQLFQFWAFFPIIKGTIWRFLVRMIACSVASCTVIVWCRAFLRGGDQAAWKRRRIRCTWAFRLALCCICGRVICNHLNWSPYRMLWAPQWAHWLWHTLYQPNQPSRKHQLGWSHRTTTNWSCTAQVLSPTKWFLAHIAETLLLQNAARYQAHS